MAEFQYIKIQKNKNSRPERVYTVGKDLNMLLLKGVITATDVSKAVKSSAHEIKQAVIEAHNETINDIVETIDEKLEQYSTSLARRLK